MNKEKMKKKKKKIKTQRKRLWNRKKCSLMNILKMIQLSIVRNVEFTCATNVNSF